MTKRRIILHPGYVESRNDNEEHYIGVETLARLYGIPRHECIVVYDGATRDVVFHEDDIHLYPLYSGRYKEVSAQLFENRQILPKENV